MADLLEERQIDSWKLEKFTIERNNFAAMIQGVTSGTYIRFTHNGECVMSDTSMEKSIGNVAFKGGLVIERKI